MIEKFREGFDVHHIDGDHSNNCPLNLVLIEHTDHMALHNGGFYTLGRLKPGGRKRKDKKTKRVFRKETAEENYARDQARAQALANGKDSSNPEASEGQ